MPVARQEFFDADRTGRVQRADKYRVTKPTRDEFGRTQNERAHEDLAEFGVGLHNPKIASAVRTFIEERRDFVARITRAVIASMAERPLASADAIAAAIWGSLHGIYLQKVMNPDFDAEAAIDALSEMTMAFAMRSRSTIREEG